MATGSTYTYKLPSGDSVSFSINQKLLIYDNFYFGYNTNSAFGKSYLVYPNKYSSGYKANTIIVNNTSLNPTRCSPNTFYYRGYFASSGTHVITPYNGDASNEQWYITDATFYNCVINPMIPTNLIIGSHVETINSCYVSYTTDGDAAELRYRVNGGTWKYVTKSHVAGVQYDITIDNLIPDTSYKIELGLRKANYQVWSNISINVQTLLDQLKLPIMFGGTLKQARVWYRGNSGVKRVIKFKYSKPIITKQPLSALAEIGDTVIFSIETSMPSTYQWQKSSNNKDWVDISGETRNTLSLVVGNSDYDMWFRCVVNANDVLITSNGVKVIEGQSSEEVIITQQPVNYLGSIGDTASFTVNATNAASYQWQYSTDETAWRNVSATNFPGGTTKAVTFTVNEYRASLSYRCEITLNDGTVINSNTVRVVLL